jgi:hypothetical protein
MATRVLLTVDTELIWRHFAAGATWQENFERCYDAAGVGVPYQLETLHHYGLKACFFVDPMPALVYGIEPVKRMVAPILAAGQEVQLHLHSFWRMLAEGHTDGGGFELTCFDYDRQLDLIRTARDLLMLAALPSRSRSERAVTPPMPTRCERWKRSAFASTAATMAPSIPGRAPFRCARARSRRRWWSV